MSIKKMGAPSNLSMRSRVLRMIRRRMKFSKGPEVTSLHMWYLHKTEARGHQPPYVVPT